MKAVYLHSLFYSGERKNGKDENISVFAVFGTQTQT
jgi:hypothetical protein